MSEALELTIEESASATSTEITGDVWELTIETGLRGLTGIGGVSDGVDYLVDVFTEDFDATGGSFTEVTLYSSITLPRATTVGLTVCIVDGTSLGLWRITASGPCTSEGALAPGDTIASLQGFIGVAQTLDAITVNAVVVAATSGAVGVLAERVNVLEADLPAGDLASIASAANYTLAESIARGRSTDTMGLCIDYSSGAGHDDAAYTAPAPATFTGGAWIRSKVTPLPITDYPSPADGTQMFSEVFTQTGDGIGVWDLIEKAYLRIYDASAGKWRTYLFVEITFVGDTSETISLSTSTSSNVGAVTYPAIELPEGVCQETAVWFDFDNGDGVWELQLLRRIHYGTPDLAVDGAEWEILSRAIGTVVGSVETSSEPWGIGFGTGAILLDDLQVRNGGPTGTMLAHPTAILASAAGEGQDFDDAQSNTWTPGPLARIVRPDVGQQWGQNLQAIAATGTSGSPFQITNSMGTLKVTAGGGNGFLALPSLFDPPQPGQFFTIYAVTEASITADLDIVAADSTVITQPFVLTDGVATIRYTGKWLVEYDSTAAGPLDPELAAIAGLTSAADKLPYFTGSGTAALADLSSFGRMLIDDANAATALTTLGAQPVDSDLTAIAALTTTSFGRGLLTAAGASDVPTVYGTSKMMVRPAVGDWWSQPHGSITTAALTLNRIYYEPIWIPEDVTAVDGIAIEVTTLGTSAVGRLGLYLPDATTRKPGALIIDAGTIDASSNGVKDLTITSTAVTPNSIIWVAVCPQTAGFTARRASDETLKYMGWPTSTVADAFKSNTAIGFYEGGVTGALPSNATLTESRNIAGQPIVALRRA